MDSVPIGRPITHAKAANDCSSDVARVPDRSGIVQSVRFLDPGWDTSRFVGRALAVLLEAIGWYNRDEAERVATTLLQVGAGVVEVCLQDGVFHVASARPVDEAIVRVTVRCIDSVVLPEMIAAKTANMADTRGLSERERQVLQLLLRGRGVEDIATVLGIAPRTVKFHQANVLQKLGADSRLDLLRVVL
jgi:DNA-binding CsgD family transcriptional regulator